MRTDGRWMSQILLYDVLSCLQRDFSVEEDQSERNTNTTWGLERTQRTHLPMPPIFIIARLCFLKIVLPVLVSDTQYERYGRMERVLEPPY